MRIQVATLNVWALPEPFAPAVLPRMGAIGDRLADISADVVAFQEVWSGAAREVLLRAGERAGYGDHWFRDDTIGGSGLLVLSRLPILESHFEPFALGGRLDHLDNGEYLSGKGFARLRVQGSDGPVHVINTHLHARYSKRVKHQFASQRVGQIIQLAARVRELEEPVVIAGDFNFVDETPEYRVLTGLTGVRDVAVEYGDPLPTMLRTNAYRFRPGRTRTERRVDYLFVRDGAKTALRSSEVERVFDESIQIEGRPAAYSNHAGVFAQLDSVPVDGSVRHLLSKKAIELAAGLLSQGRRQAERRRTENRTLSGMGMACAVLAMAGGRSESVNRRRFLRHGLRATALAALTPGIGASVMSEFVLPSELSAWDLAERRLDKLARNELRATGELAS
ncbi:MAG: hypothetical protein GY944_28150 [bacterium]|nr:hypothetical protein [bacterium]